MGAFVVSSICSMLTPLLSAPRTGDIHRLVSRAIKNLQFYRRSPHPLLGARVEQHLCHFSAYPNARRAGCRRRQAFGAAYAVRLYFHALILTLAPRMHVF